MTGPATVEEDEGVCDVPGFALVAPVRVGELVPVRAEVLDTGGVEDARDVEGATDPTGVAGDRETDTMPQPASTAALASVTAYRVGRRPC